MRRLAILFAVLLPLLGFTQKLDRSKVPSPGPAPEVRLGESRSFKLKNGLQVIVVENHRLPRVSWQLSIQRDPIFEGGSTGYVSLAGDLLGAGTKSLSKAELDEKVDFMGATLSTFSSGLYAQSLSKHKETLLGLLADVILNPEMPEEELEKLKTRTLSALASSKDDPNSIAGNISDRVNFGEDHPYGEIETEETVKSVTREQCLEYVGTYFKPNKAYLIVVGDIKFKEAKKLVKRYLGVWKPAGVPGSSFPAPEAPKATQVDLVHKPNAVQSVIRVTYPVSLKPGSPDAIKASVMNAILGYQGGFSGRLMQNIREDKAYTYGAYSTLSTDQVCGEFSAYASVRNEVTDSAVHEFLYEMKRLRDEPVSQEELDKTLKKLAGVFALSLENPQTVARFAFNQARYQLPEDYYQQYLKKLMAVSVADVQSMAKKYLKPGNAHIVIVGDAKQVGPQLERFGKLNYYSIDGLPTEAPVADIPEGLTPEQVIKDYLEAVGGEEKLKKVKTLRSVASAKTPQGNMKITTVREAPNKNYLLITFESMVMNELRFNGKRGTAKGATGPQELTESQVQSMQNQKFVFDELDYLHGGFTLALVGVEQVGGEECYAVAITDPTGKVVTKFFSSKSKLLLRVIDPQSGAISLGDYKEVKGILIPYAMTLEAMGITFKTDELQLDEKVDQGLFKVD